MHICFVLKSQSDRQGYGLALATLLKNVGDRTLGSLDMILHGLSVALFVLPAPEVLAKIKRNNLLCFCPFAPSFFDYSFHTMPFEIRFTVSMTWLAHYTIFGITKTNLPGKIYFRLFLFGYFSIFSLVIFRFFFCLVRLSLFGYFVCLFSISSFLSFISFKLLSPSRRQDIFEDL